MKIANSSALKWGIGGHPTDGKRDLPSARATVGIAFRSHPESEDFLTSIKDALPPQPWKPGVHIRTAEALGVKPNRVSNAIQTLISRGIFLQQRDGIVFDRDGHEVARDKSRVGDHESE